jgi:putative ABC transport system permease protein
MWGIRSYSRAAVGRTAPLVASLALSAGAAAALLGVAETITFPSLPFGSPDRLVVIGGISPSWGTEPAVWLRDVPQVEHAATVTIGRAEVSGAQQVERLVALEVSRSIFDVLGIQPLRGRPFVEADLRDQLNVALISDALATRWWRNAEAAVGHEATVERTRFHVVGVFPDSLRILGKPDIVLLSLPRRQLVDLSLGGELPFADRVLVKLRSPAEREPLAAALRRLQPKNKDITVTPLGAAISGTAKAFGVMALVAIALVVVGGAVNAATLYVSRLDRRRAEVAVRIAIGASPRRLLSAEAWRLAALVGAAGLIAAWIAFSMLKVIAAAFPRLSGAFEYGGAALRLPLFLGAVLVLMYGWLVSLAAHMHGRFAAETSAMLQLRVGGGRQSKTGAMNSVIGLQLMATVILASAASYLALEYRARASLDAGFEPQRLWAFDAYEGPRGDAGPALTAEQRSIQSARRHADVLSALRSIPGVQTVGAVSELPLSQGFGYRLYVEAAGQRRHAVSQVFAVAGEFGPTLGLHLLAGRFPRSEDPLDRDAALLDRTAAVALFGGLNAIGEMVRVSGSSPRRIVGVVEPVPMRGAARIATGQVYVLNANPVQSPLRLQYIVRTAGETASFGQTVQEILRQSAVGTTAYRIRPGRDILTGPYEPLRTAGVALGVFGATFGLLVVIGLIGIIRESMQRREDEVAVRLALGAPVSRVRTQLARRLYLTLALGTLAGAQAAWVLLHWAVSRVEIVTPVSPDVVIRNVGATSALLALFLTTFYTDRLVRQISLNRLMRS